jgi:hypothetical protein
LPERKPVKQSNDKKAVEKKPLAHLNPVVPGGPFPHAGGLIGVTAALFGNVFTSLGSPFLKKTVCKKSSRKAVCVAVLSSVKVSA